MIDGNRVVDDVYVYFSKAFKVSLVLKVRSHGIQDGLTN